MRQQIESTLADLARLAEEHARSNKQGELRVALPGDGEQDPLDADSLSDEEEEAAQKEGGGTSGGTSGEGEQMECPICYESHPRRAMRSYGCEAHFYCAECVRTDLMVKIGSGELKTIKCPAPDCAIRPTPALIRLLAGRQWYVKYQEFTALQNLRSNPNARWCPDPQCSTPVVVDPSALGATQHVTCPTCGEAFCFVCRHPSHLGFPCSAVKQLDDEVAFGRYLRRQAEKTKSCPRCGEATEKNGGCNHMQCISCSHEWCWLCLESCPDPQLHYNAPAPGRLCTGHWFTTANSIEEATAVNDARAAWRRNHPLQFGLRKVGQGLAVGGLVLVLVPCVVLVALAAAVIMVPIVVAQNLFGNR